MSPKDPESWTMVAPGLCTREYSGQVSQSAGGLFSIGLDAFGREIRVFFFESWLPGRAEVLIVEIVLWCRGLVWGCLCTILG